MSATAKRHWTKCLACNVKTYAPAETCPKCGAHVAQRGQVVELRPPALALAEWRVYLGQLCGLLDALPVTGYGAEVVLTYEAAPELLDALQGLGWKRELDLHHKTTWDRVVYQYERWSLRAVRSWPSTPEELGAHGVCEFLRVASIMQRAA